MAKKHHSAATIKKIRLAQMGKKNSFYGCKHKKSTCQKISKKVSGRNNPMYGKRHSAEARRKISLAIRRAHLRKRS